jgi:hypothetical protein
MTIAGAIAAAAGLAGCATAPQPFSFEESLYFDKATGTDITKVPPGLRLEMLAPPPPPYYPGPPPWAEPPPGYR